MPREKPITILLDDVGDAMERSPDDPHDALLDLREGTVVYASTDSLEPGRRRTFRCSAHAAQGRPGRTIGP